MSGAWWKWAGFNVGLPLLAPIALSFVFAGLWWSVDNGFGPNLAVIIDLTPWAIAIYSLTLIGSTFQTFWPNHSKRPALTAWLIGITAANLVYFAFLVVKRHNAAYAPPTSAYYVAGILMFVAIVFCYRASKTPQVG